MRIGRFPKKLIAPNTATKPNLAPLCTLIALVDPQAMGGELVVYSVCEFVAGGVCVF